MSSTRSSSGRRPTNFTHPGQEALASDLVTVELRIDLCFVVAAVLYVLATKVCSIPFNVSSMELLCILALEGVLAWSVLGLNVANVHWELKEDGQILLAI